MNDIGKRAHVLNNSHGKCVDGAFDKILHEGSIWADHRTVLLFILHKSIFLHFAHHGTRFMTNIYHQIIERNILMMMGVLFFLKQEIRRLYNTKYQNTISNQYYVLNMTILKIQEYVGHIQEETKGKRVMFI